jgi:MFS family permease
VYLVRILFGIGTGAIFAGYFTFASDLIPPERRTEGLALFGISGLIPLLLNPIAGIAGVETTQLRGLFAGLGLLVLASLAPLLGVPEEPRKSDAPRMTASAALDAIRRRALFSVWIATTVTPGSTPPLESATVPLICAVACARATPGARSRMNRAPSTSRMRRLIEASWRKRTLQVGRSIRLRRVAV